MSHCQAHREEIEDEEGDNNRQTQRASGGCYQFFGIKSHLHNFYDYNKPVEDDDTTRLFPQPTKKSKRCSPIIWKIILWFGINSLVFGAILILVSHFTSRRPILQSASDDDRYAIVDRRAARINTALDILGTVGIVSFCCAGALIVVAVLLPTYCNDFCFKDRDISPTPDTYSRINLDEELGIEQTIPVTQHIHGVQPKRKASESAVDTNYVQIE